MPLTFGVELEFNTDQSDTWVADRLHRAGIPTATSRRLENPGPGVWGVKHDGSVGRGWEVVSPILTGEEGLDQLARVSRLLSGIPGAHAGPNCGLHVHVGGFGDDAAARGRVIRNVSRRFVNFEDSMDAIHAASRRANQNSYCRSNYRVFGPNLHVATQRMWEQVDSARNDEDVIYRVCPERYYKLNLHSMLRHGTVEFRQHAGTIDAQEVTNWTRFVLAFVQTSVDTDPTNLRRRAPRRPREERFRKMLRGVDLVTASHMWQRRARFAMTPEQESLIRREMAEGTATWTMNPTTGLFERRPVEAATVSLAA